MEFKSSLSENHWHNISFENLITRSRDILNKFAEFCGREILSDSIFKTIDNKNIFDSNDGFSQKTTSIVQEILDTSRRAMKYSK